MPTDLESLRAVALKSLMAGFKAGRRRIKLGLDADGTADRGVYLTAEARRKLGLSPRPRPDQAEAEGR